VISWGLNFADCGSSGEQAVVLPERDLYGRSSVMLAGAGGFLPAGRHQDEHK